MVFKQRNSTFSSCSIIFLQFSVKKIKQHLITSLYGNNTEILKYIIKIVIAHNVIKAFSNVQQSFQGLIVFIYIKQTTMS